MRHSAFYLLKSLIYRRLTSFLLMLVAFYRVYLSPIFGGQCRFYPSCSAYGEEAFKKHNPIKAIKLTSCRILRCHPFTEPNYDPVPEGDK